MWTRFENVTPFFFSSSLFYPITAIYHSSKWNSPRRTYSWKYFPSSLTISTKKISNNANLLPNIGNLPPYALYANIKLNKRQFQIFLNSIQLQSNQAHGLQNSVKTVGLNMDSDSVIDGNSVMELIAKHAP